MHPEICSFVLPFRRRCSHRKKRQKKSHRKMHPLPLGGCITKRLQGFCFANRGYRFVLGAKGLFLTEYSHFVDEPLKIVDESSRVLDSKRIEHTPDYDMRANLPHNIEFVFGSPGTGKTTYLAKNVILSMLANPVRVLVLAPTNKAADVLTDRLIQFVSEKDSDLSWLVRFGVTNDERLEERGVLRDKTFDARSLQKSVTITTIARFACDYFMPKGERLYLSDLNWDYIIIDEASMMPLANIVYLK